MPGLQDLAVRLAEILDIPGPEARALALRVVPVMTVETIVGIPSSRVPGLIGSPSLARNVNQPAVGEFGHVQLHNPADSGVTIYLDRAWVSVDTAGRVEIRRHATALGNVTVGAFRDFRRTGAPAARLNENTNAARQGTTIGEVTVPVDLSVLVKLELVLAPGDGVLFGPRDINVDTRVFWLWREVQVTG